MLSHLLILLNSRTPVEKLVAHSINIAHATRAKVTILRVLDATARLVDPLDWHIRKVEAETSLNELAKQLRQANIEAQVAVTDTSDTGQLIEYVRENQVDLILVPRREENVSTLLHSLMKQTSIPILVVPLNGYVSAHDPDTACYDKILIPLDGSQRAECTLPLASLLAQTCQSKLILAHVIHKPEMPRRAPLTSEETELSEHIVETNRAEAERYLEQLAPRMSNDVQIRLMVDENVPATLHRLADDENADLIVLSAHGYTGEPQWPYGSITSSLIAYSSRPVLVIQDLPSNNSPVMVAEQAMAYRNGTR